jgi:transposase
MSEVSGRRLIDQEEPETTGDLVDTLAVTRHDLTDAQWATLQPLLPAPKRLGRPSLWSKRQLVDGIRWRIRVGAPWRDVPACYRSWSAMCALFRRWQRDGTWQRMLTALQALADAAGRICRRTLKTNPLGYSGS